MKEILSLCESWWGKTTESTIQNRRHVAEQFMGVLGWPTPESIEGPTHPVHTEPLSYVLRNGIQTAVSIHFASPGALEIPSSIVEHGLDFCETTRVLVNTARNKHVQYAFITDMHCFYLYDVSSDELLIHEDSPYRLDCNPATIINKTNVEHGVLDEIRRPPRSVIAGQLCTWRTRWCETLAVASQQPIETMMPLMDRLIVLRFLLEHNILKQAGVRLQQRFQELVQRAYGAHPCNVGQDLLSLFYDLWFDWKADLFAAAPELDPTIERDDIAVPLLREFGLLSRKKFNLATILESFNYGVPSEKAMVRMVPEMDEDRLMYLTKQTIDSIDSTCIHIQISEEGYRAIFYWFDQLMKQYRHVETLYEIRQNQQLLQCEEMDLFAWSKHNATGPEAFADSYRYAAEKGLRIHYDSPRQYHVARLMLYLHLIMRYHTDPQRFQRFPDLSHALITTPHRPKNRQEHV